MISEQEWMEREQIEEEYRLLNDELKKIDKRIDDMQDLMLNTERSERHKINLRLHSEESRILNQLDKLAKFYGDRLYQLGYNKEDVEDWVLQPISDRRYHLIRLWNGY